MKTTQKPGKTAVPEAAQRQQGVEAFPSGPGCSCVRVHRDPYNVSTWGPECARGIRYKDMGMVTDGQAGAMRKISTGRKARGMASDGVR